MASIQNLRAFTRSASLGSFAAAAREAGTVPSVIMKRVDQLEHQLGAPLFRRSTRKLALTEDGLRLLPRCMRLAADFDELLGARWGADPAAMRGTLRVGAAGPAAALLFTPIFCDFMVSQPLLDLQVQWTELLANPLQDGLDIAIGLRTASYQDVIDVPLAPYPRVLCASPAYLARQGMPSHPRDLAALDCLISPNSGNTWRFHCDAGEVAVDVRTRLIVNSSLSTREAARRGLGIAILPSFLADRDLQAGTLIRVLDGYVPIGLWLKALVPASKIELPPVAALLAFTRERLAEPWPI